MATEMPKCDTALLKAHVAKFPINQNTATEFHKMLFTVSPETAKYFDAEDLDPDSLHKSRKFVQIGAGIIRAIFNLVQEYDGRNWRVSVKDLIDGHKEYGVPLSAFKNSLPAVLKMMEKNAGGCSEAQTAAWTTLLEKCFSDMESLGFK